MPFRKILCSLISALLVFLVACKTEHSKEEEKRPKVEQTPQVAAVPNFSGKEAFEYLIAQTNFGPRNPGSSGHADCLNYLISELQRSAEAVNRQEFVHTGYRGEQIKMFNIIASFNLSAKNRILIAAHWDSRPYADQDNDPEKRQQPMLGANDGASGVAVLLQLAKIMKQTPAPMGVDIILFDGEDFGRSNDFNNFLLGSKYFASHKAPSFSPSYGILLDMIGDARLEVAQEKSSLRYAPDVVQYVWGEAERLGLREFVLDDGPDVYDDHVPLNEAGIKTIDLIDFQYPDRSNRYWHTSEDTPDKCSVSSLETIGTLLVHLIYEKNS